MHHVLEMNSIEELRPYRDVWQALLKQTAQASFVRSFDWLEVYWKHFSDDQTLRVLLVQNEDCEVVGILPLVVRPIETRVGKLNYLTYPLDDWATYYGPVGPQPEVWLRSAFDHIRHSSRDWDVVELRFVGSSTTETDATAQAFSVFERNVQPRPWHQAAVIQLRTTFDDYVSSKSKNFRKGLRKTERNLQSLGEVRLCRYRPLGTAGGDDTPRWDLYEACEEIARNSWQGTSRTGTTITHAPVRQFFRDVYAAAIRCGSLDLNLLYVGGRPVAYDYNLVNNGYIDCLRTGFDQTSGAEGAGSLMFKLWLEDSFARGDQVIDLGVGSLDYKQRWCTEVVGSFRFTHFARTAWRSQLLNWNQWVKTRFGTRVEEFEQSDETLHNQRPEKVVELPTPECVTLP